MTWELTVGYWRGPCKRCGRRQEHRTIRNPDRPEAISVCTHCHLATCPGHGALVLTTTDAKQYALCPQHAGTVVIWRENWEKIASQINHDLLASNKDEPVTNTDWTLYSHTPTSRLCAGCEEQTPHKSLVSRQNGDGAIRHSIHVCLSCAKPRCYSHGTLAFNQHDGWTCHACKYAVSDSDWLGYLNLIFDGGTPAKKSPISMDFDQLLPSNRKPKCDCGVSERKVLRHEALGVLICTNCLCVFCCHSHHKLVSSDGLTFLADCQCFTGDRHDLWRLRHCVRQMVRTSTTATPKISIPPLGDELQQYLSASTFSFPHLLGIDDTNPRENPMCNTCDSHNEPTYSAYRVIAFDRVEATVLWVDDVVAPVGQVTNQGVRSSNTVRNRAVAEVTKKLLAEHADDDEFDLGAALDDLSIQVLAYSSL